MLLSLLVVVCAGLLVVAEQGAIFTSVDSVGGDDEKITRNGIKLTQVLDAGDGKHLALNDSRRFPENGTASDAKVSAFSVRSSGELQNLLDSGQDNSDIAFSSLLVLDLCDDPRFKKNPNSSIRNMIERRMALGEVAKANYLREARVRFCGAALDLQSISTSDDNLVAELQAHISRLSPGLEGLVELAAMISASEGVAPDMDDQFISLAAELMATTTSHHEFFETGSLLIDNLAFDRLINKLGGAGISAVHADSAQAGLIIAGCRIFGGCAANELLTINRCMHLCEAPISLEALVVDRTSPHLLRQAEAVARLLIAMRRG